jgi:hypothetical protein
MARMIGIANEYLYPMSDITKEKVIMNAIIIM